MAVDLSRVASKALEAALEDDTPRKKRGSTVKALAAGAALAAAARVAVKQRGLPFVPQLPDMDGLRDMSDRLRDRFAGEPDDVDDVDVEEEIDEPLAGADEDLDDEELDDEELEDEDEEPEAEAEEDIDDEDDEDFEDEDEEPPELEVTSEDDEELHPEDLPPEPPRSGRKKTTAGANGR
jgi:hypothetical protein